jgi:hypothetical protein
MRKEAAAAEMFFMQPLFFRVSAATVPKSGPHVVAPNR